MAITLKEASHVNHKIVSISAKRQITIPQKYFTCLGFGNEAECFLRGNEIVIRPVRATSSGEFAEEILKDLLAEGYSGSALLAEFQKRQAQIRPAVEAMLADAKKVAHGEGEYSTFDEVFGSEEKSC